MKNFFSQVYEVVKQIPRGKVATYGQIAKILGRPRSSRQVGFALHVNKDQEKVPCHRVVNRFGETASGFAFGGGEIQKQILQSENVKFKKNKIDLKKYLWRI